MRDSRGIKHAGGADGGADTTTTWGWVASAIVCILVVLMITPFSPSMPFPGLDGSWSYAINVAVAEHLRFGSDIIFTFGPLASIYTRVYHPATDALMVSGSLLIAVALFVGLFSIVAPRRRVLLLLVPVVISLGWGRDAVFLFLPLLLPYVVMRGVQRGKPYTVTVCIVAAAIAILPLVKGNFSVLMAMATVISVVLCWRSSPRTAVMIIVLELVVMLGAWLLSGQMPGDLPRYFIAQAPIVSGYTDGMSVPGRVRDLVVFIVVGALLLGISTLSDVRRHWFVPVLVAAYLFISFKSGFVRHDEHAFVSAVALAYVGLLLCLTQGTGKGVAAFAVSLIGWALISSTYMPVTWDTSTARLSQMLRTPAHGVWLRLSQPELLQAQFKDVTSSSGVRPPFAGYNGEADVYPVDIGSLIGAGSVWKPRPILQSYSAYTPSLLTANAAHLVNNPPPRVYFNADPIDHRYPALEDGASWLSLLGSFTPAVIDGGYAVLQRNNPLTPALRPKTAVRVDAALGKEVAVVGWEQPVWVTMDIRPTLAGKLFSTIFKAPKLSLKVRYENGDIANYRLIAGMTQSGFLLSPTVADATDFVALGSAYRQDLLGHKRVVAFEVFGDSGTRYLWRSDYRITFAGLEIPLSSSANTALTGERTQGAAPSTYQIGGDCNIDEADHRPVTASSLALPDGLVLIRGWAALDGANGVTNKGVALLVSGRDAVTQVIQARHVLRRDVADYFKRPKLEYAGFEAYVDTRQLPAEAQVRVTQDDGMRQLLCSPAMLTFHRPDVVSVPSFAK
ncbi:hypothetical protein XarjCFBP8253_08360 [Xanthomonas arboricola pv. juglandis]|uniref:Transmembrane protein n=2 Tax=Xanthomonas arboricola TaxID=56448 RepID=A0A2S6Z712_9XANT|nr:hypothetical protein XaplCFBP3122_05335 [Xanthomonas arboricola pv. populi]PPU02140.1 hypothetical protein XarjCFBP8253_08360 [Xanthomonas arboricola pv. juglandis]